MNPWERTGMVVGASIALITSSAGFFVNPAVATEPRGDIVPGHGTPTCDTSGDIKRADDCVKHDYRGAAATSQRIRGIDTLSQDITVSPALRGRQVLGEVQFRKLKGSKAERAWQTRRSYVWGDNEYANGTHHVEVCAPTSLGEYETRVKITGTKTSKSGTRAKPLDVSPSTSATATPAASQSATTSVSPTPSPTSSASASASASPSASPSASVTPTASASVSSTPSQGSSASPTPSAQATQTAPLVAFSAVSKITVDSPGSCSNSPEDESNIEYFNMSNFNELYEIIIVDTGTAFDISMSCPSPPPFIASSGLDVRLSTGDETQTSSCYAGSQIVLPKQALPTLDFCQTPANQVSNCRFEIDALNSDTGTVYSSTVYTINMQTGNATIIPQLNAGTLPICNNTLSFASSGLLTPGSFNA